MAPCVSSGASANAMFAVVVSSWMARPMVRGNPPPPNASGSGTDAPARFDVGGVGLLEPGRRGDRAVGVQSRAFDVAGAVGGGDELGHEISDLGEDLDDGVVIGVLEARKLCDPVVVHDVLEGEREVSDGRTEFTHSRSLTPEFLRERASFGFDECARVHAHARL